MTDLPSKKDLESTGPNYGFKLNGRLLGGGLLSIVLLLFIVQNRDPVTVDFLFVSFNTRQWVVLTIAAVLGALVGITTVARRRKRKARRSDG